MIPFFLIVSKIPIDFDNTCNHEIPYILLFQSPQNKVISFMLAKENDTLQFN